MWIKKYKKFMESLNSSVNIFIDSLLNSINAEEVDVKDTLKINGKTDLEHLNNDEDFLNILSSSGMKKSELEESKNYETFLSSPCRFMFIYDIKASELDTPYYLLLQVYNNKIGKYDVTKCYTVKEDITNFYDQLSSKVIEVTDDNNKYIYDTNNPNEWTLKSNNSNDIYKATLRKEELEGIVKQRNASIKPVQNNNI